MPASKAKAQCFHSFGLGQARMAADTATLFAAAIGPENKRFSHRPRAAGRSPARVGLLASNVSGFIYVYLD